MSTFWIRPLFCRSIRILFSHLLLSLVSVLSCVKVFSPSSSAVKILSSGVVLKSLSMGFQMLDGALFYS